VTGGRELATIDLAIKDQRHEITSSVSPNVSAEKVWLDEVKLSNATQDGTNRIATTP